jgi:hypothetical protein
MNCGCRSGDRWRRPGPECAIRRCPTSIDSTYAAVAGLPYIRQPTTEPNAVRTRQHQSHATVRTGDANPYGKSPAQHWDRNIRGSDLARLAPWIALRVNNQTRCATTLASHLMYAESLYLPVESASIRAFRPVRARRIVRDLPPARPFLELVNVRRVRNQILGRSVAN